MRVIGVNGHYSSWKKLTAFATAHQVLELQWVRSQISYSPYILRRIDNIAVTAECLEVGLFGASGGVCAFVVFVGWFFPPIVEHVLNAPVRAIRNDPSGDSGCDR
jgi:hypothetical protein